MANLNYDPDNTLAGGLFALTPKEAIRLTVGLCEAVERAVGAEGSHCGVWPGNITWVDGEVAVGPVNQETKFGNMPPDLLEFISPEQFWMGKGSPASDVYSIGMILYTALNNGTLPFFQKAVDNTPEDRSNALQSRMKGETLAPPANGSPEAAAAVLKAMSFQAAERYATPGQFRAALLALPELAEAPAPPVPRVNPQADAPLPSYTVEKRIDMDGEGRTGQDAPRTEEAPAAAPKQESPSGGNRSGKKKSRKSKKAAQRRAAQAARNEAAEKAGEDGQKEEAPEFPPELADLAGLKAEDLPAPERRAEDEAAGESWDWNGDLADIPEPDWLPARPQPEPAAPEADTAEPVPAPEAGETVFSAPEAGETAASEPDRAPEETVFSGPEAGETVFSQPESAEADTVFSGPEPEETAFAPQPPETPAEEVQETVFAGFPEEKPRRVRRSAAEPEERPDREEKKPKNFIAPVILGVLVVAVIALLFRSGFGSEGSASGTPETEAPVVTESQIHPPVEETTDPGWETPAPVETPEPTPEPTETPEPTQPPLPQYELFMADVSWTQARALCEEKGGHLATVRNDEEFETICEMAEANGARYVWLGAFRDNSSTWYYVTGERADYFRWDNGEPSLQDSDGTREDYLLLWFRTNTGLWCYNDQRNDPVSLLPHAYSGKTAYVCQYD